MNRVEALRAGLRELGYVEGKNIVIEYRWADGRYDRLPELATELARLNVDVLVTASAAAGMAAKKATQTIPIVMASMGDPVATGLVASLARPGGDPTGSSIFTSEEVAKRLELLRDIFPRAKRVAILLNPDSPLTKLSIEAVTSFAKSLKLDVQQVAARVPAEFEGAFQSMADKRAEALVVFEDPVFSAEAARLAELAMKGRLPSIGQLVFAEAGGLIGNGANQVELFRRAAVFVDKIIKGTKPGDLPVEQATRFELIINARTARALGLTIPQSILVRADRVIE